MQARNAKNDPLIIHIITYASKNFKYLGVPSILALVHDLTSKQKSSPQAIRKQDLHTTNIYA